MKEKEKKYNLIVLLSFLVLSIVIVLPFIYTGSLKIVNDGVFHLQRINEIYINLKKGHFTYIATHTFSRIGLASFEFYPSVFLYPWAALRFIFKPVTAFYVGWGILFFITLVVAYFSMMRFSNKDYIRSIAFALIYGFSGKYITEFAKFQIGELIAYSFLPIVFLGFYEIIFNNKQGKEFSLAIGLSLVAYSHVLTTYLCVILMTILFVIAILKKLINKNKVISIIKNAALFCLLVIWQYVPFISNNFNKTIAPPGFSFWPVQVNDIWNYSWSNSIYLDSSIGVILIFILTFGWMAINNDKEKWIYALGVFICVATTTLFPWKYISKTMLIRLFMPFQFSFRFLPLSVLFLSVTGSLMAKRIIQKSNLYVPILIILIFGSYFSAIKPLMNDLKRNNISYLNDKKINCLTLPLEFYVDDNTYSNINKYIAPLGSVDYITKNALTDNNYKTIQAHESIIDGKKKKVRTQYKANELLFYLKGQKNQVVDLPVIRYNRTMVIINNKKVQCKTSYRGTVRIKLSKTGKQTIKVYYRPTILFYVLFIVAILSWLFVCTYLFNKKRELYEKE